MKTKTLAISVLLLAVVLAPLALAEEPIRRGPRSEHGRFGGRSAMNGDMAGLLLGRLADKLELTEKQRESIKAIREEARPEAEKSRQAVREVMKTLREATADGTKAEIIAAGKAVGDAFTEQALLRAATMKQVKTVLTDEQLAKLKELRAEMRERMQQRREDADGPRKPHSKGRGGQRRKNRPEQD